MPKWKKDATEFVVGVNHNEIRGAQTTIPKPISELLGNPGSIKYVIKGKKIEISNE